MAKKKSPAKITLELELKGHPILKKAFEDIQKSVDKFHKIQKKIVGSTKKNTRANKKYAKTIVDTQRKIRNLGNQTDKTAKANDKLAAKFSVFRSKLLLASFGASLFVGNLVRLAQAAGNVQEDMNKANVVFGDSNALVTKFAATMESEIGKSRHEIVRFAASVQDILVPLGLLRGFAADVSQEVVKLAVDVASFNNALDADVMRDFNSAIVGNHETVRKYGIVISEARLKSVAFEEGIISAGETLTDQQKILARIAILQRDSADAADDAKETFFSFNNQMKAVNTEIENTRIVIGELLMPIIKAFAIGIRFALKVLQNFTAVFVVGSALAAKFGVAIIAAKFGLSSFADVASKATSMNKKFGKSLKKNIGYMILFEAATRLARVTYDYFADAPDLEKVAEQFVSIDKELQKYIASAEKFSRTKIVADYATLEEAVTAFDKLDNALQSSNLENGILSVLEPLDNLRKGLVVLNESGEQVFLNSFADGSMVITKNGKAIASTQDNYEEFIAVLLGLGQRLKETRDNFKGLAGISEEGFAKAIGKAKGELASLESQLYKVAGIGTVMDAWSMNIQENMLKNKIAFRLFGKEYDDVIGELEQQKELAIRLGDTNALKDVNIKIKEVEDNIDNIVKKQTEVDLSKIMLGLQKEITTSVMAQREYNLLLSKGADIALYELEFVKRKLELAGKNIFLEDEELMKLIEKEKQRDKEVKILTDIINKHKLLKDTLVEENEARNMSAKIVDMLNESVINGSVESRKANLETIDFLNFETEMKKQNSQLSDTEIKKLYEKVEAEKESAKNLETLKQTQTYMESRTQDLDKQIALLEAATNLERLQVEVKLQNLSLGEKELLQLAEKLDKIQRLEDIEKLREKLAGDKTKIEVLEEELLLLQSLNAQEIIRLGGIATYLAYIKQLEDSIQNLKDLRIEDILSLENDLGNAQSPTITAPEQFSQDYGAGANLFQTLLGGDETSFSAELGAIANSYSNAMQHFADEESRLNGILKTFSDDNNTLSDEEIEKKEETLKALIALEEEELEFVKDMEEQKQEVRNLTAEMAQETFSMFMDLRKTRMQEDLNEDLRVLKESERYRVASDKRKEKLEDDVRKKYAKEQLKIFKFEQLSKIASIGMSTAEGVMKSVAAFPPTGLPWSAIVTSLGALQAGMVLSQKPPKYQYGGLVGGSSHSAGGTLIEAERGEFVMNKNATEAIGLEQLNKMNRGGSAGNNINITLSGNVLSDDFVADEFIPKLEERIRVLSDGTITDRFS